MITNASFIPIYVILCLPGMTYAQGGFRGEGSYEITNIKSGKVLDLDRNDHTTVIQFSSRGTDNQVWVIRPANGGFYFIRNAMNGNALEAIGDRNSSPLRGMPFTGADSQQWRIDNGKDGNALIVSKFGKSLDVPDGSNRDGLKIQIYDLNGDSNQRFTLRPVSSNFGRGWDRAAGPSQRITCSSDRGNRVYCDADTNGRIRMVRQISGSPCREGETWGYDRRGIWVDRGCRAEFETIGDNDRDRRRR